MGIAQLLLSIVGIYCSWEDVGNRKRYIAVFAIGCFIWAIMDILYLIALIAVLSKSLQSFLVGFIASNTFKDLAPSLDQLLGNLANDSNFITIFSSITGVLFDVLATYWANSLYSEVVAISSVSNNSSTPLLRPQASPPGPTGGANIGGFTFSRQAQSATLPSPRTFPFGGRGHRLGDSE